MPKWAIKTRLLQLRLSTLIFVVLCLIAIIQLFSVYGTYNYAHIPEDTIQVELYKEISPDLTLKKAKHDCKYEDILTSKKSTHTWDLSKKYNVFSAQGIENGSYVPGDCNPLFSVAIIVTYRNRQKQLDIFLPYMHNFLRRQRIHYKIYVVEQQDEKPWNKGMLYNIGAKRAISDKFPCLILHDVDLLPLDESNLYVCTQRPRHMSASIDKFRYVLTYSFLVGGVLAIRSDQYIAVNGFSNKFTSWGGEDDDFAARLEAYHLEVVRFPRDMSRYTMLVHHQEKKNAERLRIMAENKLNREHDGMDSLYYTSIEVKPQRLFTLIGVKL
ncbi:beta-1,4-N-acetylgalactosaminyltransferase bre-4 isoform X2 [Manduca sexta]|nr:beta-1,4-N-acetylgalactosaminyltransferase bre-4 isoform X2 [Manduca sexta]XP_030032162.1 beta-1,4-N-acetylgalactosaminyltransferase bre-4 isoform X2 [Manduca sexta]XP_037293732.1 beta-1,4-N-acetylgalactosaminyltransferase bre-4 isoform X2 [Manduca sexta]XP_037293733.1 beta-1,4-N-acetylgalactosaminyltransferase bre-4 isoform X2 [Manduca sexta]XP_037293734.1 beta-1,4-N-acetylgalactosaminyltransferase bre-4 isoform X2 [Manduca sexta]